MPIRVRLAVSFAAVTLLLVVISGVIFARSFRGGLEDSLAPGLRAQLHALTESLKNGVDSTATVENPIVLRTENIVTQVLDSNGKLLVTTREAGGTPVASRATVRAAMFARVYTNVTIGREREPHRVLAAPVTTSAGPRITIVATSLEPTDAAVSRVRKGLVIGGAAAVAFAGLGGWLLATAALRPVERMRRKATDISEHDTAARLPVPPTRDEIAALATTINTLLERLQGALAQQRAFVADASHELRTPLAVLRTELELAARPGRSPTELRDAITQASLAVDELTRLVEDLLFLARSDERTALPTEDAPLLARLEPAIAATRAQAVARGIRVDLEGDSELRASVTPTLIHHAVVNLLTNAIRHSSPGGIVVVRARREDGTILIEVADQGPGFPAEFLPDAFERFRRADESRTRGEGGAGLGLAIVRVVARAHGGTAEAATRLEGGAVVTMRIPSPNVNAHILVTRDSQRSSRTLE